MSNEKAKCCECGADATFLCAECSELFCGDCMQECIVNNKTTCELCYWEMDDNND